MLLFRPTNEENETERLL